MNKNTGRQITDAEHINQSVTDIITTPVGTRVMRRNYGSFVPRLIDSPQNNVTRMRLISSTIIALTEFEPRIRVRKVEIYVDDAGKTLMNIDADRADSGEMLTLKNIRVTTS
ncbi:GPW/gp25 family protein [Shewanella sp.]|uniref:GPW/gp25 family protein n=1 Tax=Shewanella sp. TaxID=50422 RepID=UPI003569209D